jgi:hypothetical protein
MTASVLVLGDWDLPSIAAASGAAPSTPLSPTFWFASGDDGTGAGTLYVAGVTQHSLDAALAAWLGANPQ